MFPESLKNKAREIAYALVRISCFVNRVDLRQRLEKLAFVFVEDVAAVSADDRNKEAFAKVSKDIAILDVLVRMGHSLYEIEPINATILVRELDAMNSAIRQFGNLDEQLPDLESIFETHIGKSLFSDLKEKRKEEGIMHPSISKIIDEKKGVHNNPAIRQQEVKDITNKPMVVERQISAGQPQNNQSAIKNNNPAIARQASSNIGAQAGKPDNSAIRQSAIVLMAKEQSELKIKDLIAAFPEVSERTLRYDLQRLSEQGTIERVGVGGPATFYRLAQSDDHNIINVIK
ncbi:MAG: DeoR family transcriptional regulator [Candidatus Pacebacteria bacterium]|nr:DeoR family transcriptional regulator [Candidatus Paceibacterota bacterium]